MSMFGPKIEYVSSVWLTSKLEMDEESNNLILLDCRNSNDFNRLHIKTAVNFSIPTIMLRRFAIGKLDLISVIRCENLKSRISSNYKNCIFVLYNLHDLSSESAPDSEEMAVLNVLLKRLLEDGCNVMCLKGGFSQFNELHPEFCESTMDNQKNPENTAEPNSPVMGIGNLRLENEENAAQNIDNTNPGNRNRPPNLVLEKISHSSTHTSSADSSDTEDSSLSIDDDRDFPVEVLPFLFLGNANNSSDNDSLSRNGISFILNVTSDLPNVFETQGVKYLQIPITDHWSQNLASYFPEAIDFIDEARSQKKGVLVHCLAGISRSVTIIMAYLMYKCALSLNDAFNIVRTRKRNISPNFHFMAQLHTFEKELSLSRDVLKPTDSSFGDNDKQKCLDILNNLKDNDDDESGFGSRSKRHKRYKY